MTSDGEQEPGLPPTAPARRSCWWWLLCLCLLLLAVCVALLTETGDAPYVYPPS